MDTTQRTDLHTFDLPNRTPQQFQKYVNTISKVVDLLQQVNSSEDCTPDEITGDIIIASWLTTDPDEWDKAFNLTTHDRALFFEPPPKAWKEIAHGLQTPEVKQAVLIIHPGLDWEKYFRHPPASPVLQEIQPHPSPKPKLTPAPRREETLLAYVTNHAPSLNYIRSFIFISRHTRNRFSSYGRKVYPYGQEYIAQNLGLSLATVERVFSWLRRQHLIYKRTPEIYQTPDKDPKRHKCATWFVCTSRKQSTYFLDPLHKRPKKGSPRSRRKRHHRDTKT